MSDMISSDSVEVASSSRRGVLDCDDSVLLLQLYNRLKPGASCTVINSVYVQHSAIMYRCNIIGKPAQVWCCNQFETGGVSSFCQFASCKCVVRMLSEN